MQDDEIFRILSNLLEREEEAHMLTEYISDEIRTVSATFGILES